METIEGLDAVPEPSDMTQQGLSPRARYLCWVAERVRREDFWSSVREDVIERFASLLTCELPDELWGAAYSQRDGQDYLIAFQAVQDRLEEHCGRIVGRE